MTELHRHMLDPYQLETITFGMQKKRFAAFLGMSLGKTAITLTLITDLIDSFEIAGPTLVVAPLRVAKMTWPAQAAQWSHCRHLKVAVVAGSREQRLKAVETKADIHVVNQENVEWLIRHWASKHRWPYQLIAIDESSAFKSHESRRWKCMKIVAKKSPYVMLLTATPSANSLLHIWSQIYLLDGGQRLGASYTDFRSKWFEAVDRDERVWVPKPGAQEEIEAAISDIAITLISEEHVRMPTLQPPVDVVLRFEPEQARLYRRMEKDFLLDIGSEAEIVAANAAALTNKLMQISAGAVYDTERDWHELHDLKIHALQRVVDKVKKPLLVAYWYEFDQIRIRRAFPNAEVLGSKPEQLDRWNRGEIPMLLAHPRGAAHGLNLQFGSNCLCFFTLSHDFELYHQFVGRLLRRDQPADNVWVFRILVEGTVDFHIAHKVLDKRQKTQAGFLRALRDYYRQYVKQVEMDI